MPPSSLWAGWTSAGAVQRSGSACPRTSSPKLRLPKRLATRSANEKVTGIRKMAIRVAASIPPMTTVPRIWRETPPEPLANHKRNAAEDEGEGGHQDGAEAEVGPGHRRFEDALAFFVLVLGEFDDQDGVLGRKTDQHHQADLRVNVVFKVAAVRAR
jgi:hypothetical protein